MTNPNGVTELHEVTPDIAAHVNQTPAHFESELPGVAPNDMHVRQQLGGAAFHGHNGGHYASPSHNQGMMSRWGQSRFKEMRDNNVHSDTGAHDPYKQSNSNWY